MTSTEGLFIRHSDQQPGFLQVRILIKLSNISIRCRKKVHPSISLYRTGTGVVRTVRTVQYGKTEGFWIDCTF